MKFYSLFLVLAFLSFESGAAEPIPVFGYQIVNVYPHDKNAFTQGLVFRDEWLYESTGLRGSSSIRKIDLETGRVVRQHKLADQYFGEGIVDWNEQLISVTWHSGTGFVFAIDDFTEQSQFEFEGEGWGLTRSESQLVLSDGTSVLRFLSPDSFEVENTVAVTLNGRAVPNLNELEWVEGEIFSNVWRSDWVLRIDPNSGEVTGLIDFSGLLSDAERVESGANVLNGIAYDAGTKRLFVTGKKWPKLFEVELFETNREL